MMKLIQILIYLYSTLQLNKHFHPNNRHQFYRHLKTTKNDKNYNISGQAKISDQLSEDEKDALLEFNLQCVDTNCVIKNIYNDRGEHAEMCVCLCDETLDYSSQIDTYADQDDIKSQYDVIITKMKDLQKKCEAKNCYYGVNKKELLIDPPEDPENPKTPKKDDAGNDVPESYIDQELEYRFEGRCFKPEFKDQTFINPEQLPITIISPTKKAAGGAAPAEKAEDKKRFLRQQQRVSKHIFSKKPNSLHRQN